MKWTSFLFVLLQGFFVYIIFSNIHFDISRDELKDVYTNKESEFVSLSHGLHVHFRDEGDKDAPILVLLHGTASSLHTWDGWVEYLKKDFRIIRMDLPGFGLTGPPLSSDETYTYSLFNFTSFLKEFLDKKIFNSSNGNKKIHIGGNSLGGAIAWLYAGQYPHQVDKLILVDSMGIYKVDHPINSTVPLGILLAGTPIINSLMKYLTPRSLVEKSVFDVYGNDSKVTEEIVERHFHLLLHTGNREAFVKRTKLGMVDDLNNAEQYVSLRSAYKGHTLIQWGEQDIWINVHVGHKLKEVFQNSRLIVYQAGHIPQEEIPEETAKDAKEFLLQKH